MKREYLRTAAFIACGAAIALAAEAATLDIGRALGVVRDLGTAATDIPEKDEIAIGRELAGRTLGAAPLVNDRAVQSYVNRVGRWVASQSERPDLPWRFGVIDTSGVNAFAAPGGIILVTRGLYDMLDNEAQLAGVLGHEVAHVMKRHHITVIRKQAGVSALAGAAQVAAETRREGGGGGLILSEVLGTGAEVFTKKLDQNAEFEADHIGALLAVKAGYSPAGMIDVLHKLHARAGEPSTNLLFATHPHPSDRLTALGDALTPELASLPPGDEPPLQVAITAAPSNAARPARAAPAAARGLAADQPQQREQQDPPGGPLPSSLLGGQGGMDGVLRGIFGR